MNRTRYLIPKIYGALGYQSYYAFSYSALDLILSERYKKWNYNPFNYYEFGTGKGNSLRYFLKSLKKISKYYRINIKKFNVFLFDSFEGLPEYDDLNNKNPVWQKGQFKGTIEEIKSIIDNELPEIATNVKFIKGYYERTLTKELRVSMNAYPPSIVNIDVDYYTSAKTVLEWIYSISQDGTIFYFDDIYEYLGNLSKGEYKAIGEFNSDHLQEGFQFYPFQNFGIPSFIGKIFTLNRIETNSDKKIVE
jgi:hypothetical protein